MKYIVYVLETFFSPCVWCLIGKGHYLLAGYYEEKGEKGRKATPRSSCYGKYRIFTQSKFY